MPTELPAAAIADAGPLIHLDELGRLEILAGFRRVFVPSVVGVEADRHRPAWRSRAPEVIAIMDPEEGLVADIRRRTKGSRLDRGELSALALWLAHREAIVLCDDLGARRCAEALGCKIAGTLGLLLWAARVGRLDKATAVDLVRALPERTSLHIHVDLIESAIRSLED